jgi:hypothetical protein
MAVDNQVNVSVDIVKAQHIRQLATMSAETLQILADLSKRPDIEKKLKVAVNNPMLKMFL